MGSNKLLSDIQSDWNELLDNAHAKFVYGESFNKTQFTKCMRKAYEYFILKKTDHSSFDIWETELYGSIREYSGIPAVIEGKRSVEFKASTCLAGCFAQSILHPEMVVFDGYVYQDNGFYIGDGEFKTLKYNFKSGDLKDFIEMVRIGYWD